MSHAIMLNEKPNVRHRIGSARAGGCSSSSSSRVGSASSGFPRRASSARPFSSDYSNRPKLYTGRPSSAPPVVPRRRPSSAPAQGGGGGSSDLYSIKRGVVGVGGFHVKSHDVSHLNLKVEGKSIRSVAFAPRRHQPVNRGSLRVVSNHGYCTSRQQKQFFSDYNAQKAVGKLDVGSDSDRSSMLDFGKTYTLTSGLRDRLDYESSSSLDNRCNENFSTDLGSTYTKHDKISGLVEDKFGNIFPGKVSYSVQNTSARPDHGINTMVHPVTSLSEGKVEGEVENSEEDSSRQQKYSNSYFTEKKIKTIDNFSEPLSENSFNIRPHFIKKSGELSFNVYSDSAYSHQHQGNVVTHLVKRDVDTTSNDGSECTVISLGRKIQLMATSYHSPQEQVKDTREESEGNHWDSEWKQLLKQNHELLLKLSSREEKAGNETNVKCDHVKTVLLHDSGVQTGCNDAVNSSLTLRNTAVAVEDVEKLDSGICSVEVRCDTSASVEECLTGEDLTEVGSSPKSDAPECVLEDIIEESSQSSKSSPRDIEDILDSHDMDDKPDKSTGICESLVVSENNSTKSSLSRNKQETESEYKELDGNDKFPSKVPYSGIDFSCTTDLPTYRLGLAAGFAMKSLFPYEKQSTKSHPSKDLLEALQMIEDEENKIKEGTETSVTHSDFHFQGSPSPTFQDKGINTNGQTDSNLETVQEAHFSTSFIERTNNQNSSKPVSSSDDSADECVGATLPVIQVLVEKVFLFTQDLAERWQQGEFFDYRDDLLRQVLQAEKLLEDICIREGKKDDPKKAPDLHFKCEEKIRMKQEESEARIQKNLELIRKLLDDKKLLTEQCEEMQKSMRVADKKHSDKIKLAEERHSQELKNVRERIISTEQDKREKWFQQKTKSIKESTYRGLESKMKDLSAKHRDEISQLKAQHWDLMKEAEEKFMNQMRCQAEDLKKKFEEEKEELCKREREREQQRLELEIRQCEQHCLSRMEALRKQHEQDIKALIEERHRNEEKLRADHCAAIKDVNKEKDQLLEQLQENLRVQIRKHEEELISIRREDEQSRSEWRAVFMKEHNEARIQSEKELRERLKRQRDKEIERVIKEIKQETTTREEEEHKNYEFKMKNIRERYELELNELETSEREARSRYLEMKSILAQKEEEVIYLRARLHTQDIELCELQHMFQPPGD
ncbi:myosin-11-like isoform X1 [Palaemon carinicauda]|uniref:myosin-11-like isoform X1 n=1 Tax=Palaemon carinicauda TaxID=392227 RepID=UPI0035B6057D